MYIFWIVVQVALGFHLVLPIIYFLLFQLRKRRRAPAVSPDRFDYAIIVTAYEQTHTIPAAIASILKMNYGKFLVYIVADKCDVSELVFTDERVIVLRPETALNSNTRSHLYAVQHFRRQHDYVTIVDSDNLVAPEYLNELNRMFAKGYVAVQGVRKAKNLDTTIACLDAVQDIYYHFYDREVLFHLGSSASLAGSGMAFEAGFYKRWLEQNDVSGAGFDKLLQFHLVQRNKRIAFSKNAIVFDEKTSRSGQLVKQRARWINTWFRFYRLGFRLLGKGIAAFNRNQVLFSLMLLRPPLFLLLLITLLCVAVNFVVQPVAALVWVGAVMLFAVSFFIALLRSAADRRIYISLLSIPKFVFYQVVSLFKARKANAYSVATQHYHAREIEDVKL